MVLAVVLVLLAIAVLAVAGLRLYRPKGVDPDRGQVDTSPPPGRDRTWDPQERYTEEQ